jgi:hypothetical protein
VAAKEALLTILAKVKEEELPVLRFVRELILVLYLYRFLNIMRHQRRNLFNQGDQASFSKNFNKVYGTSFSKAFDSSFKFFSFFVHI